MARFETLTSVAIPITIDHIDTDQIFPSRFISKDRADGQYGTYFLHDRRFDEQGQPNKTFVFNDSRYGGGKIIVASENYACGSARPGAIFSHIDYGIEAVIAESFGPLFAQVAVKSGLLCAQLDKASIKRIRDAVLAKPGSTVTVDVKRQIVTGPDGYGATFDIDPFAKEMFTKGLNEIELTLGFKDKVDAFEAAHRKSLPWVYGEA